MRRSHRFSSRSSFLGLGLALFCFVISLGSLLRTFALEAEARTTERWYHYKSTLGFEYQAQVQPGHFYPVSEIRPEELVQIRVPVDPPAFRRVLISQYTDSVTVSMPYHFSGDREANLQGLFRVDGKLVLPGFWQREYPFIAERTMTITGAELSGEVTFSIPIAQLLADLDMNKEQLGFTIEPLEVHLLPVFEVLVSGLKEPVAVKTSPSLVLSVRKTTVELPEPKEIPSEQILAETVIVPVTVPVFGKEVRVGLLRQISLYAFGGFVVLSAAMLLFNRPKKGDKEKLSKLGPNVVKIRAWEPPAFTALATVRSAEELLQLLVRTEQPIMKLGNIYYLVDGMTCYKLELADGQEFND